jgi:hypothetical protein
VSYLRPINSPAGAHNPWKMHNAPSIPCPATIAFLKKIIKKRVKVFEAKQMCEKSFGNI